MATKKPAKIASSKKGKSVGRLCPNCGSEMTISKIIRVTEASGMYWLCSNSSCSSLIATSGAAAGTLNLK